MDLHLPLAPERSPASSLSCRDLSFLIDRGETHTLAIGVLRGSHGVICGEARDSSWRKGFSSLPCLPPSRLAGTAPFWAPARGDPAGTAIPRGDGEAAHQDVLRTPSLLR